jgi:hypothetical protein
MLRPVKIGEKFFAPKSAADSIICASGSGLLRPAEFPVSGLPARGPLGRCERIVFFANFSARQLSMRFNHLTSRNRAFSPVLLPVILPVNSPVFA